MKFRIGKVFCVFAVLSLIMCLSAPINDNSDTSITMQASGEIDNDAIMNGTGDAIEEGLPFVIQMAFIAAGVGVIMSAIYTMMPKMGR